MIKQSIAVGFCIFAMVGCFDAPRTFDTCMSRSDEGFIQPLSDELSQRDIEHEIRGHKLCFKTEDRDEVDRADSFVRSFRYGVATILNDQATEIRIVEWLIREQKSYEITHTTNGERFLVIRSESEKDKQLNREKLSEIEEANL